MSKPFSHSIDEQIDVEVLRHNFDLKEKDLVRKTFEPHELTEMKERYFLLSSRLNARQELAKVLKAAAESSEDPIEAIKDLLEETVDAIDYGTQPVKEVKSGAGELLKRINVGYEDTKAQLWGVAYHECGRMAYYDDHGLFVYDRPLKPTERQTSIRTIKAS